MTAKDGFPEELLLNEPDRRVRLIRELYEQFNEERPTYGGWGFQYEKIKTAFYRRCLEANGHDARSIGVDVGCQGAS
jgi:hypothetical protein